MNYKSHSQALYRVSLKDVHAFMIFSLKYPNPAKQEMIKV